MLHIIGVYAIAVTQMDSPGWTMIYSIHFTTTTPPPLFCTCDNMLVYFTR
jgi:hypothetical protein